MVQSIVEGHRVADVTHYATLSALYKAGSRIRYGCKFGITFSPNLQPYLILEPAL